MFCAIWEFAQSADRILIAQSADCAIMIVQTVNHKSFLILHCSEDSL